MRRYIFTGTPGCGKTTVLAILAERGFAVAPEAATDVIAIAHAAGVAEPHTRPTFIDDILALQKARRLEATQAPVQLHDRSAICTAALCAWLGYATPPALAEELAVLTKEKVFAREVFFLDNLGFVAPTAARRISYEDSLAFEKVHEATYRALGYELVRVPKASPLERADFIEAWIEARS